MRTATCSALASSSMTRWRFGSRGAITAPPLHGTSSTRRRPSDRSRSMRRAARRRGCRRPDEAETRAPGRRGSASDRRTDGCGPYVSEIVMWPWPMEAADHTGRHVDRRHITDWPRWGSLRHRWTERRLSWCAMFVRLKIVDPSGSITLGRLWAASEPDILRRPQAYSRYRELCIPPASVAHSTTSDDVGNTCRQIESNQSSRYTAAAARVLCYRVRETTC
jgi:hypothetical protein